jgi:MFS family permease
MLNNLRILQYWKDYFGNPQESTLGLLTALYSIGSIASLPITPYLADHFGRKICIVIGCLIMIVGAGIQAGAKNLSYFMGGRFLMGFGNSLAQLSSPLLLTEICRRLQLSVECWCHCLHLVDIWYQAHRQRLVLEDPSSYPGCSLRHPVGLHLVHP